MNKEKIKQLKQEYNDFRGIDFPSDGTSSDDLHCDFVMYDSYIASYISRIITNAEFHRDAFKKDPLIRKELDIYLNHSDPKEVEAAKKYLPTLEKIEYLIDLAIECYADEDPNKKIIVDEIKRYKAKKLEEMVTKLMYQKISKNLIGSAAFMEIQKEIIEYDSIVWPHILAFNFGYNIYKPVLQKNPQLRKKIQLFIAEGNSEEIKKAKIYLNRLEGLEKSVDHTLKCMEA